MTAYGWLLSASLIAVCGTCGGPTSPSQTTPAPQAVLNVRFDSFGAAMAITGLSPIQFDGTRSSGDGLSYRIEFGDGQSSSKPIAIHPVDITGPLTARLTVVDRFGRTD